MDINEITKQIEQKVEVQANKYLDNIDSIIDRLLESSILSLIGLERGGYNGRVEIDHCNSRNSVLIDAFRNRAIGQAEKLAKSLKLDAGDMKQYRDAFRKEYSLQINREIKKAAEARAKSDAEALVGKIKTDVSKFLDPNNN